MRVSTRLMYGGMGGRLSAQAGRMIDTQQRIASGRQLQRPSDDPAGAARALLLDSRLADLRQYESNAQTATASLATADSAISQLSEVLRKARTLALAGGTDTVNEDQRRLMADQIDRLILDTRQVADTRYAGRYLFSGTEIAASPLAATGDPMNPYAYAGNGTPRFLDIAEGTTVAISITGQQLLNFGGAGDARAPDVFAALANVRERLLEGDTAGLSRSLDDLDHLTTNATRLRAQIGQTIQRVELNVTHLRDQTQATTELRAGITDTDLARALVDYRTEELTYQATVALSARLDQPGVFELLR